MEIEKFLNTSPESEGSLPPQAAIPVELQELLQKVLDATTKTQSAVDDQLAVQLKQQKIQEFVTWKSNNKDVDENTLFASMEDKYNEYVQRGLTPEMAQMVTDTLFQNPRGWEALASEIRAKSKAVDPDNILDPAPASSGADNATRALMEKKDRSSLGAFITANGGTK